MPARRKLVE